jgi:hypothetical protein
MKNEADVKKVVKKILSSYPETEMWYFMPPANGYGRSGIPDFVGCYKGNFFAIETKFGDNHPTNNQLREIQGLYRRRVCVGLCVTLRWQDGSTSLGGGLLCVSHT